MDNEGKIRVCLVEVLIHLFVAKTAKCVIWGSWEVLIFKSIKGIRELS